jgi:iron complex transport system ATP-binding protein
MGGPNPHADGTPGDPGAPVGWSLDDVGFRYPLAAAPAIDGVSTTISAGRLTALIGPNGSGKSTLIRLLLGALEPDTGMIRLGGRPIGDWSRRELARTIGVVPQNEEITFPLTARELVTMGRYPHLGTLRTPGPRDLEIVDAALERCDVLPLADRSFNTLSGGERQRVRIARALAQVPVVLALDEPTLALDIGHEMRIFELARAFATSGATVLVATHNLNLAARFADQLILLAGGRLLADGPPESVLRPELLEEIYEWPLAMTTHPGPGPDAGAVQVTTVRGRGQSLARTDGREESSVIGG